MFIDKSYKTKNLHKQKNSNRFQFVEIENGQFFWSDFRQ